MKADLYFPKTAQTGIFPRAATVLRGKIQHAGEKTVDNSRILTNLHLGSKLVNYSGGI